MYNKLFTRILFSSVWTQPYAVRIVWVTFLAAMDEDGIVHLATTRNVAALAQVTEEEAQAAVAVLEGPDPSSTNTTDEGRRVERIPGGWVVLNAKVYREIATRDQARQRTAERVRKFRATGGGPADKLNALRHQAMTRDGFACRYCGEAATEIDHVVPRSRGGGDTLDNLVAACARCNASKCNRTPDEAGMTIREISNRVTPKSDRVTLCNDSVTGSETETETQDHRSSTSDDRARFDRFWAIYPRKVAKAAALKAWTALRPDAALLEVLLAAVERQVASEGWRRDGGAFIPHAATWLRGRRWEDEIGPVAANTAVDDERARSVDLIKARQRLLERRSVEG